jgi:hypothetical protein
MNIITANRPPTRPMGAMKRTTLRRSAGSRTRLATIRPTTAAITNMEPVRVARWAKKLRL